MTHQRHRRMFVSLVLSATVLALTASDRILNAATSSQEPSGDGRVDVPDRLSRSARAPLKMHWSEAEAGRSNIVTVWSTRSPRGCPCKR